MKDEEIMDLLFARNQDALPFLCEKYGRLYGSVLRGILREESDIEECGDDVLLSVWNSIPPNRPERLSSYLCAIAKRVGIDRLRYNTRARRAPGFVLALSELEECLPDEEPIGEEDGSGLLRDALDRFLRRLEPSARVLFLRRYVYGETPAELASRFDLRENTVCAKLSRTRKKLKEFLESEGITV